MVLFTTPKLAAAILAGRKTTYTVPRRPYRGTCTPPPPKVPPPWQPNTEYPVQVERMRTNEMTGERELGRESVFRVRVTAVWPCLLNDFNDQAAQAEGFEDAGGLFQWWRETREGVEPPAATGSPAHEIPVWTAALVLAETPRFLAPGAVDPFHVPADEKGYLTSPVRAADEQEVVPDDWQAALTGSAKHRVATDRQARRQAEQLLPLERQIVVLQREAQRRRVDIRNEVRLIAKLKEQGKAIDNPVHGIRRKLDRDLDQAA